MLVAFTWKTSQKNHKLLLIKPDCHEKPGVQGGLEAKSRTELTEVIQALLFLLSFTSSFVICLLVDLLYEPMPNELLNQFNYSSS